MSMSKSSTRAFKRLLWSLHFFFCGSGALLILQSTFFLKVNVSSFLRAERKVHRVGLVVPTSDWNPLCQPSTMLFDRVSWLGQCHTDSMARLSRDVGAGGVC